MSYALYSPSELASNRAKGLQLTNEQNENFYAPNGNGHHWTNEQFEAYLGTKRWDESVKNIHRDRFKGYICIENGTISYE